MSVVQISPEVANPFIIKWHYSQRAPRGKNIHFGWYIDGLLYAVADYGIGVNPYQAQSLARSTGLNVNENNLLELKRLCRIEPRMDVQLTYFIARCHRLLKQQGYKYVVSFSDPAHGHNGGIYKASNFAHLGQTNSESHAVDKDGNVRHRRQYYRYAKSRGIDMETARNELGLTLVRTVPKDRWFISISK